MIDLNCTERVFIGRLEISIPGRTSSSLVTSCEGSRLHRWGDKFPIRRRFMIADMGLHGSIIMFDSRHCRQLDRLISRLRNSDFQVQCDMWNRNFPFSVPVWNNEGSWQGENTLDISYILMPGYFWQFMGSFRMRAMKLIDHSSYNAESAELLALFDGEILAICLGTS